MLGPVFRGYDPDQDRVVAIKAFSLDLTPEQAADLAAEFDRLAERAIPHGFIILPLAGGVDGSTAFLAEEYFVAESTDVALKQYGPPPLADALRLIGQLAGALDAAAAAGVHHGALHPRDVLVAPHEMRLTGLGVVPALERVGFRPQARIPYAAPERMLGKPATHLSDVFSLACVSFELLTGRRPVPSGDTVSVETSGIRAADASALSEVFARVLSERPEDRYVSALAFAAALKHALTGAPLQGGVEVEAPKPRRVARARQAPVLPFEEVLPPPEPAPPPPEPAPPPPEPAPAVETAPEPAVVLVPEPAQAIDVVGGPVAVSEPERRMEAEPSLEPAPDPEPEPTVVLSPPAEPEPGRDAEPVFASFPSEAAEPFVVPPSRHKLAVPLGMLAAGLVIGFVARDLVAPRGASVPAAAPAASVPAAAPLAAPAISTPAAQRPAQVTEAPVPAADSPAGPDAATKAPSATARAAPPPAPARSALGTLVIRSKPAGARVLVDGWDAGKTPLTLHEVKAGSHKIRLERAGYRPWTLTVRVAAGGRRNLTASLRRRAGG